MVHLPPSQVLSPRLTAGLSHSLPFLCCFLGHKEADASRWPFPSPVFLLACHPVLLPHHLHTWSLIYRSLREGEERKGWRARRERREYRWVREGRRKGRRWKEGREEKQEETSRREEFKKTVGKTREEDDRQREREGQNRLLKMTNEPGETTQGVEHKYSSKGLVVDVEMAVYSCKLCWEFSSHLDYEPKPY